MQILETRCFRAVKSLETITIKSTDLIFDDCGSDIFDGCTKIAKVTMPKQYNTTEWREDKFAFASTGIDYSFI